MIASIVKIYWNTRHIGQPAKKGKPPLHCGGKFKNSKLASAIATHNFDVEPRIRENTVDAHKHNCGHDHAEEDEQAAVHGAF
jgi:hypothetical protein